MAIEGDPRSFGGLLRVLSDWVGWRQATPVFFPGPFRGSLASLRGRRVGRRMMGSGERGVSICFTTLPGLVAGSGLSTRSPRPSSPRNDPGIALSGESFVRVACSFDLSRSRRQRGRLLSKAELGCVGPHAMQDDGELAGWPAPMRWSGFSLSA